MGGDMTKHVVGKSQGIGCLEFKVEKWGCFGVRLLESIEGFYRGKSCTQISHMQWRNGFCISSTFSGDADIAGPWTTG